MRLLILVSVMILTASTVIRTGSAQESVFNRNLASSAAVQAPRTDTLISGCSTSECHPGIKEHTYLHGPLQVNSCDACHVLTSAEEHQFRAILPRQELCGSCHDLRHSSKATSVHEPLAQGECLECHDAHGSEQPRAIRSADRASLCLTCHDALTDGRRLTHESETKGSCSTCHESHSSNQDKLLIEDSQTLCLSCHVEMIEKFSSAFSTHPPALDDCRLCHNPHASEDSAMLITDRVSLCTGCHQEIGTEMDAVSHPHAAMTQDKGCVNCHQPHASEHGKLLRATTADPCYQCHDRELTRAAGGTIANMAKAISESPNTHNPAVRGDCTLCHQVHGNNRERLLQQEYVPTYSSFENADAYSLCFSCHDKNLVLTEKSEAVTSFRNGELNLHFVHVNSRKSRSCNICHDPHAAQSSHMIRATFPFGPNRWALPIDWENRPDGGSCAAGCHAAFDYNRVKAVVYPPVSPGDEDAWRGRKPIDPTMPATEDNK